MKNLKTPLAFALLLTSVLETQAWAENDKLQSIKQNLEKGQAKTAVIELKSLLQEAPDNGEARVMLGEAYLRQGEIASAVKELEKAKALNVPAEKWAALLAQSYLLDNQAKKLLDSITPDSKLPQPIQAQVFALRGMAQLSIESEKPKAQESFKAAIQADANAVEAYIGLSMLELSRNQAKQAMEYAVKATEKGARNPQAWLMLAESKRASNDVNGAVDAFSHVIQIQPSNIKALIGRATSYVSLNKNTEARADLEVIKKVPGAKDLPIVLYTDGLIDFQAGKNDEAKEKLTKASSIAPEHLQTSFLLGSIAFQKGENEQAEYHLSKVVQKAPNVVPAVKMLAATKLKENRPKEAIALLQPLVDKDQKDAQLLAFLGSAYLKDKQYDRGIEYLSKAAEISPNVAAVRAELGLGKIAAGKVDQGVADLKSASIADPKLTEAEATVILALIQQKKFDEAIAEAVRMKSVRKDDPIADNLLGAAYMAKGDLEKAKQSWQNALTVKPEYTPASINLAKLAMKQGNFEQANQEYEKVLKYDPNNLSAFIGLAQVAELNKDFPKMVKILEEARQKNPKDQTTVGMLVKYYLSQGKGLQALTVANEGVNANPNIPMAQYNLGIAQLGANQAQNATNTFKQLIAKNPTNPELHHLLAQSFFRAGDKGGALKAWDEALKVSPDYIPALLAKAELALQDKRYPDVHKIAEIIKTKMPKSPLGPQLEGDGYTAQGLFPKALTAYEAAFKLEPSSYLVRRLSSTNKALHQDQAAIDVLNKWLVQNPRDVEVQAVLGSSYLQAGKNKEAVEAFEKAYQANPDNLALVNDLAWAYQEIGDPKALSYAEKLSNTPGIENKTEILDTVGWVFLHNGKEDKGLTLLQQAALLDPHNAQVHYHLAAAFVKVGKKEEAKKNLEKLLKENPQFHDRAKAEELLKSL